MQGEKPFRYGVLIGRFQLFHNTHKTLVEDALKKVEELIIIIGSKNATRSVKNPFTAKERVEMIKQTIEKEIPGNHKIHYVLSDDFFYNENMWIAQIQHLVGDIVGHNRSVALFGAYKDETSYYVNLFPQWKKKLRQSGNTMNSTSIRNKLFSDPDTDPEWCSHRGDATSRDWRSGLPKTVVEWVENNFLYESKSPLTYTEMFKNLRGEYQYLENYKNAWEDAPFPPTFVTVDAVVIKSGHVLVVERNGFPGKGLIALPGGFLNQDETIEDGMIRELSEESNIDVPERVLRGSIINNRVFDYPHRSLRGRTITHAYHIDLGTGPLPKVQASSDARTARFVPIHEALSWDNKFFEDHWHILHYFFVQSRGR